MNNPKDDHQIWIVIPAFNEQSVIASVIAGLKSQGYHSILVVNDGSTDKTEEIAREAGAEVLSLLINRGQGAALKTGLSYLRDNKNVEIVVTFDADGQHRPEDIAALIKPIQNGEADIVLGSRFLRQNNIPCLRRVILWTGILFTNIISQIKLSDTHNGLRALSRTALERIEITHRGMEHASDIIDEISVKKLRYKEVPVTVLYTNYSVMKGQRSGSFVRLGIKILLNKYFS